MQELRIISTLALLSLLATSCYYDVEEEIYPTVDCQINEMSYVSDILPIIQADCYTCHSVAANFGNVTLEGYDKIKQYVDNGSLLGVVSHDPGYSPMPKNGAQILQCEIEKIESWIIDGALNN